MLAGFITIPKPFWLFSSSSLVLTFWQPPTLDLMVQVQSAMFNFCTAGDNVDLKSLILREAHLKDYTPHKPHRLILSATVIFSIKTVSADCFSTFIIQLGLPVSQTTRQTALGRNFVDNQCLLQSLVLTVCSQNRNWVENMDRGMQTAQFLEFSEYTSTVCCLLRTSAAEPEKGSIVSDEQKGAECWKACSHGCISVKQPPRSFMDSHIRCKDNRGCIKDHKAAH